MIDTHPIDRTEYLPGLQKDERAVWRRWLNTKALIGDRVAYAYRIGRPDAPALADAYGYDPALGELLSLEVDAIIQRGDRWLIIEVKPRVCMSAIGQLLVYRHELERRQILPPGCRMACVAGQDNPLLRPTYFSLGIDVDLV